MRRKSVKVKRIIYNKKRVVMLLVSLLFGMLVLLPQNTVSASANDNMYYDYGTYDVQYIVDGIWNNGYNVRVLVTNKTNDNIDDWEMVLKTHDTIINIWNAKISYNDDGLYIIDNDVWNKTIAPQETIVWGYTANYNSMPDYGCDFEIRERVTEDITNKQFENVFNVMTNCDLNDGEKIIVDNSFIIECEEEEEQEMQMARAGAYTSTKTSRKHYYVKVLSTSKKAFTISQTATIVVNSIKNTVRIKSYKVTVDGATLVSQKITSNLNVELSNVAPCYANIKIRYKNENYYFLGGVRAYSTGGCTFSFDQL